jgi:hypothetical protein
LFLDSDKYRIAPCFKSDQIQRQPNPFERCFAMHGKLAVRVTHELEAVKTNPAQGGVRKV